MTLLKVRQVADYLAVSPMTVYRMIRSGELPAMKVGRQYRIDARVLEAFLAAHGIGWTPPG